MAAMLSVLMQALDSTIANVALPYMQGALSASSDEITWVLTSYVIAAAIMTAPVGWMAVRFGRKRLFIACLVGFTVTSMLCGAAQSLEQIVVFRLLQGMCGAALVPLSQATMLDIYPFERRAPGDGDLRHGRDARADPRADARRLSDRAVQLALGVLRQPAVRHPRHHGLMLFMPKTAPKTELRFDWTGFGVLALGVGALQLMLDRGQDQDWFSTREIIIEAVLAALGIYLFIVHMLTAEKPFLAAGGVPRPQFRLLHGADVLGADGADVELGTARSLPAEPRGLPGLHRRPRDGAARHRHGGRHVPRQPSRAAARPAQGDGERSAHARLVALRDERLDARRLAPGADDDLVVQGFGMGLVFNPMTVVAFTTLAPSLRGDATSMQALARNVGAAIGISVTTFMLARSVQTMHADIAATITPFHRAAAGSARSSRTGWDPATAHGAQLLDRMINRQAEIIAYTNDYRMMAFVVVPPLLLLLFMRRANRHGPAAAPAPVPAEAD